MPTKRCCCGNPCYFYAESFARTDNDVELLEPDWEVCGSWSAWSLGTGGLVSVTPNVKLVLKHMVGNPYARLLGQFEAYEGDVYLVHVYQGVNTGNGACTGSPSHTVRFEWVTSNECNVQILAFGSSTPIVEEEFFSPSPDQADWFVCVGDGVIEASISSSIDPARACVSPSNHWFAIENETVGTTWKNLRYEDHYNNNRACDRCERACCFPDQGQDIKAFSGVTIHNIGDADCGTCATSVGPFYVDLIEEDEPCDCEKRYVIGDIAGPHNCGIGFNTSFIELVFTCNPTTGAKGWSLRIVPTQNIGGSDETIYSKSFVNGTPPWLIRADTNSPATIESGGSNSSCNYEFSYVTFEPVLIDGCCTEVLPEAIAMNEQVENPPINPCTFLKENTCDLVSMLAEQPVPVTNEICKACSSCSRPRRLNEVTILMLPEGDIRNKAVESMLAIDGVGTDLSMVFGVFAETNMSCGCSGLKDVLNTWTVQQIRANKSKVIDRIYSEAVSRKIPVPKMVIASILEAILIKRKFIG